jgi:hypothetical protein
MHPEKYLFPYIFITCSNIFQMETGELGRIGKLVVSLVEMGPRLEHETVTLLLHQMVACPVLGQELKVRFATKQHALSVSIIELQKEPLQSFDKFYSKLNVLFQNILNVSLKGICKMCFILQF